MEELYKSVDENMKFEPYEFVCIAYLVFCDIESKIHEVRVLHSTKRLLLFCKSLNYLGWKDSNLRMPGPKPGALPLGDIPIFTVPILLHKNVLSIMQNKSRTINPAPEIF